MLMSLLMIISGISMLISMQKHALTILLTMEFMVLASLLLLTSLVKISLLPSLTIMSFLTLIACEGTLGLSLIVTLVRFSGNDYLSNTSLMKF